MGDPGPDGGSDIDCWTTEAAQHAIDGWIEGSGDASEALEEIARSILPSGLQDLELPPTDPLLVQINQLSDFLDVRMPTIMSGADFMFVMMLL